MVSFVIIKGNVHHNKYFVCLMVFLVYFLSPNYCHSAEITDAVKQEIEVSSSQEVKNALQKLRPGSVVSVAPGLYSRGIYLKDVHGLPDAPIVIEGADAGNPPVFTGLGEGLKFSSCSYIKVKNIVYRGFLKNGVNIDDAGRGPAHHICLENISIMDIGPKGNHDALKMSGVQHFVVRNCSFTAWGGSGIDMVGCQNGLIEKCSFIGKSGFRTASAIQIKGGSRYILVQNSIFRDAGWRIISVGGVTGLKYFRPEVMDFEAKWITVAGNTFVGGESLIAWVTAQESHVHHNLFYLPEKWLGRILQETKNPQFEPSGKGLFENNLIVVDDRVKVFFNVGKGTRPSSFIFRKNAWFNSQRNINPTLPVSEVDGVYNVDPKIKDSGSGLLEVGSTDVQLKGIGPGGYLAWVSGEDFSDVVPPLFVLPEISSSSPKTKIMIGGVVVGCLLVFAFVGVRVLRPRKRKRRC